jgi:hypothetical protein
MAFSTDFALTPIVAALSLALAAATRAAMIRDDLRKTGTFSLGSFVDDWTG